VNYRGAHTLRRWCCVWYFVRFEFVFFQVFKYLKIVVELLDDGLAVGFALEILASSALHIL
jgi:hypothetical protein